MSLSKPVGRDVIKIYKSAFRNKIPWNDIAPPDINEFLSMYQNATGCSKELVISCLLPLVATLCGPDSDISNNRGSFTTSLNTYIFAICVSTGGKSNTMRRVISPVLR